MKKSLLVIGFFVLFIGIVQAENKVINIASQDLPGALHSLSSQTGIQLLFVAENMQGFRTPSLNGPMSAEEALTRLLQGTLHTFEESGAGTYVVKTAVAETELMMPEVKVTGQVNPDSPYSTQYKVPNASTATKTNTPIMEIPLSIQVVPKSVLNDQQAFRLEDALKNVSGVFPQQGFGLVESFNIRGFETFDYYRDGVRFQSAQTQSGSRETANIERIEVLKGPASFVFGRVEPGGLINLVTKKPQVTPYYSVQQQFGAFNTFRTTADATGGLNGDNTLLYRLNFAYEDRGSFRQFVDNNHFFLAPVLQWRISDRTQVTVEMEYKTGNSTPDFGVPAIGNRPANLPVRRNLGESFMSNKFEEIQAGFNWSHAFSDQWEIKHRFNLQYTDQDDNSVLPSGLQTDNRTLDRFFAGFRDNKNDTYSTSLDLTGSFDTFGIKHTVLMGGDYFRFDKTLTSIANFNFPSINIFNPVRGGSTFRDPTSDINVDRSEEWFGLYFQDQMELPHNIHLLAGFRYDNAKANINNTFQDTSTAFQNGLKDDRISPRVGILWQPIKQLSFYGNYVENFGVPNVFPTGLGGQPLKAETAQQWEAGVKTEFFDGRFNATVAWFQLTKQNAATGHPDPALAGQGFSVQTGEAQNEGIELDISGELLPGWNIIANYAYTDSEITRANDITQGNSLPNVPKHAGNIWSTYTFQNEMLSGLRIGGGVTLRGKREGNRENNFQMPGYTLVNLMTSYAMKVGKTRVTAQLNVNNLFDIDYFPSSIGFGRGRIVVGTPRVFLGSIRVEY